MVAPGRPLAAGEEVPSADIAGAEAASAVRPASTALVVPAEPNVVLVSAMTVAATPASTVPAAAARSRHLRMDRSVESRSALGALPNWRR
jgi:hypothetical protein